MLLVGYVLLMVAYTLWLKHMAVFDIAVVASGFIVRAIAGGLAVDVPISRWFLIVTSFGSLFMVAGKRYGEHVTMGAERETVRATLAAYSSDYLRYVYTMASARHAAGLLPVGVRAVRASRAPCRGSSCRSCPS